MSEKAFTMDGSEHQRGRLDCDGCSHCCGKGQRLCYCGGVIHEQAIYGPACYQECDGCGTEGTPTEEPDEDSADGPEPKSSEQRRSRSPSPSLALI